MSDYLKAQEELDAQIYCLELELGVLKRRRNDLSPISRIPPEIMESIFFLSLSTLSYKTRWKKLPDYMRLGHVSRAWREIALGYPALWSLMQIRQTTDTRLLEFQLKNTKGGPLSIEYLDGSEGIPTNVADVCKIIGTSVPQLKRLEVDARAAALHVLLVPAQTSQDQAVELEEVSIRDITPHELWRNRPTSPLLNLFPGGTPKLRTIRLFNFPLRWNSTVLMSPCLTEVWLRYSPWYSAGIITREAALQLFSSLRQMPQLKVLRLEFPVTLQTDIHDPLWTTEMPPVALENLKSLILHAHDTIPITTIMPAIALSKDTQLVQMTSAHINTPDVNELDIAQVMSSLRMAFRNLPSPETLTISTWRSETRSIHLEAKCPCPLADSHHKGPNATADPNQEYTITVTLWPDVLPAGPDILFPLADPQHLPLFEWWLADLRILDVKHAPPPALWAMIAELPSLTDLIVWALSTEAARVFFEVLDGDSQRQMGTPWKLTFPTLKTLVVDVRQLDLVSQVVVASQADTALNQRRDDEARMGGLGLESGVRLNELRFLNCDADLESHFHDSLSSVATNVIWMVKPERPGPAINSNGQGNEILN